MPPDFSGTEANIALLRGAPQMSATTDSPAAPDPASPGPQTGESAAEVSQESEVTAPVGGDAAPTGDHPPPRHKPSFGERLGHLTQQRDEANQQRDRAIEAALKLTEKIESFISTQTEARQERPATPPPEIPRPRRQDYVDPDAYEDAYADWVEHRADQRATERATKLAEERIKAFQEQQTKQTTETSQQREFAEVQSRFQERRTAFMAEHADYQDFAERDDLVITLPMADAITRVEQGPAIAYYLGKNPDEAKRIAAISNPMVQIYEIGLLAAKVSTPPRPEVTRAPPPPQNRVGSSANAGPKDPSEMTTEEYAQYWESRQSGNRRIPMLSQRAN